MESMADRQSCDFVSGFLENFNCLLDCFAGAPDHGLMVAVDVRDHQVSVDGLHKSLDFAQRGEHGCHAAVIFEREAGHFTSARTHRFERVGEGEGAGSYQRAVLAEAMAHGEVWFDAVCCE